MKLVSILIPCYNHEEYITETLESAIEQTYPNIEIIYVDDKSTDKSLHIATEYSKKYKNVKVYENEQNLGYVLNHNRCYEKSSGDYVVFLSSDDSLEPTFVEKCIEQFEKFPTIGMVATGKNAIDEKSNFLNVENFYGENFFVKGIYQCKVFLFSTPFGPTQVLIKRECLENPLVGGVFKERMSTHMDSDLFFRICYNYDLVYIKDVLANYRILRSSASHSYEKLNIVMDYYLLHLEFIKMSNKNEYLKQFTQEAYDRLPYRCLQIIQSLLKEGSFKLAKRYLRLAEAMSLAIADTDYFKLVERIIENKKIDNLQNLIDLQNNYYYTLKSDESRNMKTTIPFDLPDNAIIF